MSIVIPQAGWLANRPLKECSPTRGYAPHGVFAYADPWGHDAVWHWGDGTVSKGPSAAHVYEQPGVYHIDLCSGVGTAEDTRTVTVLAPKVIISVENSAQLFDVFADIRAGRVAGDPLTLPDPGGDLAIQRYGGL